MNRTSRRLLLAALPLALVATACGGGDDDGAAADTTTPMADNKPVAPTTTTPVPATTEPTTTEAGINSYSNVQPAVVQIIAQGTFRDPEIGFADGSGAGSGFIISPDGLAVTNNHVVAGAATLEVYIGGELDDSYNATILGTSECNDLALIKINADEDLPYLQWYDGEITPGLDVYAAGYPLGDPEFTLTRGIIAKAEAGGDLTGTSSIDHTVEHDAAIQPGNSGGPLVDDVGEVVAINYAGGAQATTTEQFFAIASDLAQPVIDKLRGRRLRVARHQRMGGVRRHARHLRRVGRRRRAGLARVRRRDRPGRHRHVDERPAGGHRRHVQGLLRRHPHRR